MEAGLLFESCLFSLGLKGVLIFLTTHDAQIFDTYSGPNMGYMVKHVEADP